MNLSLSNCRGQTYDGSSNMMGKKSGVLTQILTEQPKAVTIHCQGHSLSLSVKSMTKECDILHDVLSVAGEICILVKLSPKREHLLGNISDNIGKKDSETFKKLKKSLLQLWEECLEENLDQEAKVRIVGCKSQMESFYFFRHQSVVQAL